MKTKLKGFTLVELIVVMAIMSILMVAIMNMWKPVRDTYVDSTQYEAQRTAQNGVVQYITESVRFATDMGLYNNVTSPQAAAKAFAEAYCDANGYSKTDPNNLNEIYKHAEVIIIDNTTQHYSKNFTGRLVRRKVDGTKTSVSTPSITTGAAKTIDTTSADEWRTALGEAYYGENTFYITFDVGESTDGMLKISVASTRNGKRDISRAGKESVFEDTDGNKIDSGTNASDVQTAINDNKIAVTRGAVFCRNLTSNKGVASAGIFDTDSTKYTANNSKNAYIVFLNKDNKDAIEAAGLTS